MKTYQFGIVALGFAGMAHAEAIRKNPPTRLQATHTRDTEKFGLWRALLQPCEGALSVKGS